jgi:hypothetical protein
MRSVCNTLFQLPQELTTQQTTYGKRIDYFGRLLNHPPRFLFLEGLSFPLAQFLVAAVPAYPAPLASP